MIKAVIFDLGGVLIDNPAFGFISYCAKQLKVPKRDFANSVFRDYLKDFQKGSIKEQELWHMVCKDLEVKEPDVSIDSLWEKAFRSVYREKSKVFDIAYRLHEAEYKTAVLSNTELPTVVCFVEKNHCLFDFAIFSCLEGTRKPEERIYKKALEKIDAKPEESVFIDDIKGYLEPAKIIGIKTIQFKNPNQLERELEQELSK